MHRFFVESLAEPTAEITDSEAHHLIHVLRLKPGDPVELMDGRGTIAAATVERLTRRMAIATVAAVNVHPRDRDWRFTVAASPPKGDRLKWMVEKLTEIGVDRFVPLQTRRSVVTPRDTKLDRLQATVVSACKQSGRPWLMSLDSCRPLSELLPEYHTSQTVIAHPGAQPVQIESTGSDILLLIGPEGGFTDDEVSQAVAAGATGMAWPGAILRTETAAVVLSSLLLTRSGK